MDRNKWMILLISSFVAVPAAYWFMPIMTVWVFSMIYLFKRDLADAFMADIRSGIKSACLSIYNKPGNEDTAHEQKQD